MNPSVIEWQVLHPGKAVVLPRSSVETIFSYDFRDSSLPVPMPTAVSCMSSMVVVWMAPWASVHDGFQ